MYAAASGHSTLGIPAKVGKEFVAADRGGKLPAKVSTPMTVEGRPSMGGKGNKR